MRIAVLAASDESLAIRVAWITAIVSATLAVGVSIATLIVRTAVEIRRWRDERAVRRWRPAFMSAISGEDIELPTLRRRDRIAILTLWNHLQESVRGAAREGLRSAARRGELDVAARKLLFHRNEGKNIIAAVSLGNMGDTAAWAELAWLASHPSTALATAAARALIRIAPEEAVTALTPLLTARNDWHFSQVAALLMEAGAGAAARAVVDVAEQREAPNIPRLLRYLEQTRETIVLPVIRTQLYGSTDPETIAAGLHALGELRDPRDVEIVRPFVTHPVPFVRTQATTALAKLATPEDVPLLIERLHDDEWWVRYRAAQGLAALPFAPPLDELHDTLESPAARAMLEHAAAERRFA